MLIQVTTKHGKKFRRAGMRFGPRPRRLWVGEAAPPDSSITRIGTDTLARLEQATGDDGPLFIERDVPSIADTNTESCVVALREQIIELEKARDKATKRAKKAENDLAKGKKATEALRAKLDENERARETLQGTVASYEAALAETRGTE